MKRMIKFTLFALILGTAGTVATSAIAKGGHDPEARLERLADELELTPAQRTKVEKIFADRKAKAEKIKADKSLSYDEKTEQLKALRRGGKDEVAAVLTDAQKAKFQDMKQDRREHRRDGRKELRKMAESLDLTDAQKVKVKALLEDSREERQTILEAHDGDRKEAREELKAHREKTATKIRALLTPEQQKKFDAHKAEMMKKHGEKGARKDGEKRGKK